MLAQFSVVQSFMFSAHVLSFHVLCTCILSLGTTFKWKITKIVRPVSYVALSSNLIQTNLIEPIKCDGSASYETN